MAALRASLLPHDRHATGWMAYFRPTLFVWVMWWAIGARNTGVFLVASLIAEVEIIWWSQRFSAVVYRRRLPWQISVFAGFMAWVVDPCRIIVGAFLGLWWLIGYPTVLVNRQRYDRRPKRQAKKALQPNSGVGQQIAQAVRPRTLNQHGTEQVPTAYSEAPAQPVPEQAPAEPVVRRVQLPIRTDARGRDTILVASTLDGAVFEEFEELA